MSKSKRLYTCSCSLHGLTVEADEHNGVTYGVEVGYWELGKGRGRESLVARLRRAWGVLRGDALLVDTILLTPVDAQLLANDMQAAAS